MLNLHFDHTSYQLQAGKPLDLSKCTVYESDILTFCQQYLEGNSKFDFSTSGSTGAPKTLVVRRDRLAVSARATLNHLKIKPGGNALLCINAQFTGGRMMLVRAMEGHLNLWVQNPTNTPDLTAQRSYDLVAMVPLQVRNILGLKHGKIFLGKCTNLLIGGAPVDEWLESELSTLNHPIYHTFGMTETLSHFALKRLSGPQPSEHYQLLPGYQIRTDEEDCLIVSGPVTGGKEILTNDVVQLIDHKNFVWLGRKDQVINSGGYKIYPLKVERAFQQLFAAPCHLLALADQELGQKAVLFVETDALSQEDTEDIRNRLRRSLHAYEVPKSIITLPSFPLNKAGKTDLQALKQHLTTK